MSFYVKFMCSMDRWYTIYGLCDLSSEKQLFLDANDTHTVPSNTTTTMMGKVIAQCSGRLRCKYYWGRLTLTSCATDVRFTEEAKLTISHFYWNTCGTRSIISHHTSMKPQRCGLGRTRRNILKQVKYPAFAQSSANVLPLTQIYTKRS